MVKGESLIITGIYLEGLGPTKREIFLSSLKYILNIIYNKKKLGKKPKCPIKRVICTH